MASTNEIGLATERVRCSTEIDLNDLHCSTICENILWKPVSCQQCETHFCQMCISKWIEKNPNQCPLRCNSFIQRPCSKFIARQLAKLQVACIYQSNGCNEIVPYDSLEKHELICHYRYVKCNGCLSEMLQKNLIEHQSQCTSVVITCEDCKMNYKPNDVNTQHSDRFCLKEQLRQLKRESQIEIQQLREQLQQTQNEQTTALVLRGIISNDDTVQRQHFPTTAEIDLLHRNRIVPGKDSETIVINKLFCAECHNVMWRPICCRNCGNIFCKRCRPQVGFFNKITTFFGGQRPRHGRNNCEIFEEGPIPDDIVTGLARLQIRCAYAPNGCRETVFYYDLEEHEMQCEFELIPCQICELPLSGRSPTTEHTLRSCFEEMYQKNPAGIQQQFMALLDSIEKVQTDNRVLKASMDSMRTQMNHLKETCEKKATRDDK